MIYEYAIDPSFVEALLSQTELRKSFINACQRPSVVISNYPEKFGASVYKKLQEELENPNNGNNSKLQKKFNALLELRAQVVGSGRIKTSKRFAPNDDLKIEHARMAFRAILKNDIDNTNNTFKKLDWLREENCELFILEESCACIRTLRSMTQKLKNLLQCASDIIFVDPHFNTTEDYCRVYEEYFKIISQANDVRSSEPIRTIRIICANKQHEKNNENIDAIHKLPISRLSFTDARDSCQNTYNPIIPHGIKLKIERVSRIGNGQALHDRFILTDVGGICIGHGTGTDWHHSSSRTEISVLSDSSFNYWSNVFNPDENVFSWEEEPIICEKR